ncbi:MAG: hypothetical protein ACKV22_10355 [Bryobacteraceae bacterium]
MMADRVRRQESGAALAGRDISISRHHPDFDAGKVETVTMLKVKLAVPLAILAGSIFLSSSISYAKPELTKKEKKPCITCHVTAKSKDLNDTGKCYQKSKSLDGCVK